MCDDTGCYDIAIGLADASCDAGNLADTTACPRCLESVDCNADCDPESCILCPGQSEEDLPDHCTGTACPEGYTTCGPNGECGESQYCNNGCCIGIIQ